MMLCDWLDVTYSPASSPHGEVLKLMLLLGAEPFGDGKYRLGTGLVKLDRRARYVRVSLSGSALAHLRSCCAFLDMLDVLGSHPHKVTRLDAAFDVPQDAAAVIAALDARYPDGQVALGRKSLPVRQILDTRPDGKKTGTFYVGHRTSARATARVYDKAWERLQRAGESGPPRTRYEVTVRKDYGATLRDAAEPERLFWHVASPALLDAPEDVEPWDSGWGGGWRSVGELPARLPTDVLGYRVENSPEVEAWLSVVEEMGPQGRVWLARRVLGRLGVDCSTLSLKDAVAASEGALGGQSGQPA